MPGACGRAAAAALETQGMGVHPTAGDGYQRLPLYRLRRNELFTDRRRQGRTDADKRASQM